ncbi:hypothetical protein NDU88_001576 [Pleurodeles waltl]|uniref:Uncharacterized protein n=1 Tax=Pleurodeles waltl TaxID=8319 RepID=A0AAV7KTR3_PLEWA|nr:hypothetical protein NDU88_001576 [Pleurodeles waltl]
MEYSRRKRSNKMASRHWRSRHSNVQVGDTVLVWDRFPGSKFRLLFEDHLWTVTRRQGSLVVAKRGSEQIARNISRFKKFQPPLMVPDETTTKDPCPVESDEVSEDIVPLPNGDSEPDSDLAISPGES